MIQSNWLAELLMAPTHGQSSRRALLRPLIKNYSLQSQTHSDAHGLQNVIRHAELVLSYFGLFFLL